MRIIDKNIDFYDYLQGIYRDDAIIFDRTNSFNLTKEIVANHLVRNYNSKHPVAFDFVLLQICNTFWLFLTETKIKDKFDVFRQFNPYTVKLLSTWKDYTKERKLINIAVLDMIKFFWWQTPTEELVLKQTDKLIEAVKCKDYRVGFDLTTYKVWQEDKKDYDFKTIPILKMSGFSQFIDPETVYFAIDEYFSLKRTESERTESVNITNKEKIVNHGFDYKTLFRGKGGRKRK